MTHVMCLLMLPIEYIPHIPLHHAAQGNLEGVTAAALDGYGAQLWMLAPPCQPFTRRGLQRDTADGRAASFLRLLALLPELKVTR